MAVRIRLSSENGLLKSELLVSIYLNPVVTVPRRQEDWPSKYCNTPFPSNLHGIFDGEIPVTGVFLSSLKDGGQETNGAGGKLDGRNMNMWGSKYTLTEGDQMSQSVTGRQETVGAGGRRRESEGLIYGRSNFHCESEQTSAAFQFFPSESWAC